MSLNHPVTADALFARANPRTGWDQALAQRLLQQRFGRPWQREDLLHALIVIQHHFGGIAPAAQQWLARQADTDRATVQALIDFYHFLDSEDQAPAPLHLRFSSNIIEQHQGLSALMHQIQAEASGHLRLSTTSCIGLSDQGPAALINGFPLTRLTPHRIDSIVHQLRQGIPLQDWPADWFAVESQIQLRGPLLSWQVRPDEFLGAVLQQPPRQLISTLIDSGLRGRGGAGFPTGIKWQHCADTPASERYVVCNADEGEPGTFKDRVLMQEHADALLCGITLCAHAISARKGIIYLRGEYLFLYAHLQAHLQRWRQHNWLHPGFDIEIHLGAGAYVCGEETALLESVEGKRGIPRIKPPFPVNEGLHRMPTVVNNVETFIAAAWIAIHGADAFRQRGTADSTGSHVHSISGDCERPGIYECAFGISVDELLQHCGAQDTAWVQLGGPSGTLIDHSQCHLPLAYESISPGGSIMIFDSSRSLQDIARNFTAFFAHESCGFCTPCRAGTQVLQRELSHPLDARKRIAVMELAHTINDTSHCGLGQTAGRPALAWLQRESC